MTTVELAVLIGSVVLVALVWVLPIGRSPGSRSAGSQPASEAPHAGELDASAPPSGTVAIADAAPQPTPIAIAVRMESMLRQNLGVGAAREDALPPSGWPRPTTTPFASSTSSIPVVFSRPTHLDAPDGDSREPIAPGLTTDKAGAGPNYPATIPIPVAMSVAAVPQAEDASEDAYTRRDAPFESSSADGASLTWSSRPASEAPRLPSHGASSATAPVSDVVRYAPDVMLRRRLMFAAGAGLVLAVAVATRR